MQAFEENGIQCIYPKETGEAKNGISGINFPLGSMGVHSLGDGEFCFVDPVWDDPDNLSVNCVRYRLTGTTGTPAYARAPLWIFVSLLCSPSSYSPVVYR